MINMIPTTTTPMQISPEKPNLPQSPPDGAGVDRVDRGEGDGDGGGDDGVVRADGAGTGVALLRVPLR